VSTWKAKKENEEG